ncbi:MAG: RagB/SusD family nutrient uptake outer membrane protein [Chloroflexi bacterium]|nr:RagB/SusD family nutrient uptake outer membrane protein [Chloroflexota bacterium]
MTFRNKNRTLGRPSRVASAMAMAATVLAVTGCESLLEVDAPSRVAFDALTRPGSAPLLVNSARVAFECALSSYTVAAGLMGNELEDAQLAAALWSYDRRDWLPAGGQYATGTCDGGTVSGHGVYQPLQTAVLLGDTAVTILSGFTDAEVAGRTELSATASAYAGYSVLLVGEAMCQAPLHGGASLTRAQLFSEAEQRFTVALSGSPSAAVRNMATVGRARARLNQGNTAGALSDARAVPDGFRYDATYATTGLRESNRVERSNNFSRWVSVAEPFWSMTVEPDGTLSQNGTIPDPRVPATNTGALAQDQTTILWTQGKYTARDAPIPIARTAEALLIIAEIERGQTAVDIVNQLHTAAGLPSWTPNDVNDDIEILGQVIGERFRELFLESHHYFSLQRYHALASSLSITPAQLNTGVPYFPAVGVPFKHGGVHGDQPCLPLPDAERLNNPNIS